MKHGYRFAAWILALGVLLSACAHNVKQDTPEPDVQPEQSEPQPTQPDVQDAPEEPGEPEQEESVSFRATVLEAAEPLLVTPAAGSAELSSADEFLVSLAEGAEVTLHDGTPCTLPELAVGDTVEITYNGQINETFPAQITAQRIVVIAKAEQLQLLNPVEGEWIAAELVSGECVTVEESDDAFVLRALDDLEKVEVARVYYDEQSRDYVQKDLLWMRDCWQAGSTLSIIAAVPLDGPSLSISWQDEYGERERRLILPLRVRTDDELTYNVLITTYLAPFSPVELSAQVDSEGNGTTPVSAPNYRGYDAYGFEPTQTEIICRLNYDLDACGRKESVQLLRVWDEFDQCSFALRIVKNGVSYDTGVAVEYPQDSEAPASYSIQLPKYAPQLWLADLNGDSLVEVYFGGDMASDDYAFTVWTVGAEGLQLVKVDEATSCASRILGFEDRTVQLESWVYVLGTYAATCRYSFGATDQLEPFDVYWQIESDFALTLIQPLGVTLDDGTQTSLPTGTQLYLTATDAESIVFFRTQDGKTGSFAITQNENGYSWDIAGVSEYEYFELLPYAG